ncbi:hypothetical protein C2G38_2314844 [Gigaspora rosea]|uniref:Uncharacterized protein n=1 Tax=Gigaspora rosea TaxID=44941 RepID=A0A397W2R5_9GLOM|nr:hypothetical protein C2G38_2314844 [Gigaspora rosea]
MGVILVIIMIVTKTLPIPVKHQFQMSLGIQGYLKSQLTLVVVFHHKHLVILHLVMQVVIDFWFFSDPQFVNCQYCDNSGKCQVAGQYTSNWTFDASQTPQKGIYYDIWLSVYWECSAKVLSAIRCAHQDVHYRNIVV